MKKLFLSIVLVLLLSIPSLGWSAKYGDFTNGNAFFWDTVVDLSSYGRTDTGSTSYLIELLDAAGKKATGYIGAVGAGETLGSETLTGWTCFAPPFHFETFITSGKDITSAMETASGAVAYTNLVAYQLDSLLKITANMTITSGTFDFYFRKYGGAYTQLDDSLSAGLNTFYRSVPTGYDSLQINGSTPSEFSGVFSVKKVTDPPVTAVHIISSLNGTTRNWASIESGFDPNTIASWQIKLLKRGISLSKGKGMIDGGMINTGMITDNR